MSSSLYDVAIIGGGPAGSTAAALLARAGRRVVLFEREKFPRFHIGESLLPFSMKAFTRLGLQEKFLSAGFLKKYGGEIMGACSDTGTKFYFKDGYRSQTDHAYQVTRGDFDKVLLDHAAIEDDAIDLLYPTAKDELRDLMEGEEPPPEQAARSLHEQYHRRRQHGHRWGSSHCQYYRK